MLSEGVALGGVFNGDNGLTGEILDQLGLLPFAQWTHLLTMGTDRID